MKRVTREHFSSVACIIDAHKKMQSEDDEEMLKLEDRIGDYRKIMDELNDKIKLHEVSKSLCKCTSSLESYVDVSIDVISAVANQ